MAWKVSGDPQAPQDAIAWFRARVPLTKDQWLELEERARRRAFTVAGVAQLDVVADVWQAMDQAIDQGLPFKDFKAAVRDKLERAWGGTVGNPGYRIETIFRVQVQEAYNAGRWRQMTEPAVLRARPFWLYDAVLDRRTTAICRERDGKIYRADDPWWQTNYPPLHFRCRSGVRTLSAAEAEEFGGESRSKPRAEPHPGFGVTPLGEEWSPWVKKLDAVPLDLAKVYLAALGISGLLRQFFAGIGPDFVPIAALDDELVAALGAKSRTVRLSRATVEKQLDHHPEIPEDLYWQVQGLIDSADLVVQDKETALVFISSGDEDYYFAIKTTKDREELYLTSLRRASPRDRKRAKQKGRVIRER